MNQHLPLPKKALLLYFKYQWSKLNKACWWKCWHVFYFFMPTYILVSLVWFSFKCLWTSSCPFPFLLNKTRGQQQHPSDTLSCPFEFCSSQLGLHNIHVSVVLSCVTVLYAMKFCVHINLVTVRSSSAKQCLVCKMHASVFAVVPLHAFPLFCFLQYVDLI